MQLFNYKLINDSLELNPLNCDVPKILTTNRNVTNIKEFLSPTKENIENPMLYSFMKKARDTYVNHISNSSKIGIVVDCDVDGNTSAYVIYDYTKRLARMLGKDIELTYYIHDNKNHNLDDLLDEIINSKINLLIYRIVERIA